MRFRTTARQADRPGIPERVNTDQSWSEAVTCARRGSRAYAHLGRHVGRLPEYGRPTDTPHERWPEPSRLSLTVSVRLSRRPRQEVPVPKSCGCPRPGTRSGGATAARRCRTRRTAHGWRAPRRPVIRRRSTPSRIYGRVPDPPPRASHGPIPEKGSRTGTVTNPTPAHTSQPRSHDTRPHQPRPHLSTKRPRLASHQPAHARADHPSTKHPLTRKITNATLPQPNTGRPPPHGTRPHQPRPHPRAVTYRRRAP